MIENKPGNGILIFDTNPLCANVYVNNKFYGTTEKSSLQIMNVKPGEYSYYIELQENYYEDIIYVNSDKISHVYINFKTNIIKDEIVPIGTPITNYIKYETQPIQEETDSTQDETEQQDFKSPFDSGEPILEDEIINEPIIEDKIIVTQKHVDYYDVASTITTASTSNPNDPDSPVYNKEEIYKKKGRYSERLIVKNDGFIPLYVIVAHATSTTTFSREVPIYSGEIKTYYNIYEIRLRSSVAGSSYRVMEYDLQFATEKGEQPEKLSTSSLSSGTSFNQALSINQIQTIHIPGLVANKIKIIAVNGQSKQNLKYRLIFWSSQTANSTNLDTDTYVTDVILDFSDPLSAFQIDTGGGLVNQYYLDVSGLDALYEDADETVTLHMSLQNLSDTSKIAGANGAVQFDIKYVMRV